MEYVIETRNLTKAYGTSTVVDKVNIHVPKGKIYGLLGRNGAGKTTIMSMILKLTTPTDGEIEMFGKDCKQSPKETYHRIGSIIETPGFYENLTGKENLQILERLRGGHKKESIQAALQTVGLEYETKKTFGNYSLGMKQRLGIAAAVMHEPELLILDEPINGLDPVGITVVRNYLETLCREKGTTILISSHILSEVEQLADIIGVMNEGKLIEEVTMEQLHKRNRQYIEFVVSKPSVALKLLETCYQITDCSVHDNTIKIYDCTHNCGAINKTFVENGLLVTKINLSEENLEDYFSELIGGGGIA
ncbi:ATP-binding cassette domain-containing protein [Clostridium sp. CH2]|uniref:ABC transporter ATP-binding protein n=1 Tax=Clostridium sp. CH2 TaxID=2949990 RepID=UPI0020799D48|nr:ATP-binding cassette domain-containing protein [Clostridium sp. CH2]